MTYDDVKKNIGSIYPVNLVKSGYDFYVRLLTEKCLGAFEYANLPTSLPAEEIEYRLILTGMAGIFKHKEYGIVTCYGSTTKLDHYYKPTEFLYTQPVLNSGYLKIHKECVIIYNNEIDFLDIPDGFRTLIRRYARMLADIDSSINITIVNTRATNLVTAKNQQVAKTVDEVMKKMRLGDYATINEQSILDCINTFAFGGQNRNSTIEELLMARESMLRSFLSEIGIKRVKDKKERQLVDEVSSDEQLLEVNLFDMLKMRRRGIDEVNKIFGTDISVKISPEYMPNSESEDVENEDI